MSPIDMRRANGTLLSRPLFVMTAAWLGTAMPVSAWRADAFAAPAANTRILKIIHGWPDDPKAQDARITKLKAQGFGGVVCNVAFDRYLEDETKWQSFIRAVDAAKGAGMALWLYDEKGYPSGTAGGIVLRDRPEWVARGLLVADAIADGGKGLTLQQPPGNLLFARAFPYRDGAIDLKGGVDLSGALSDGKLTWTAPDGRWHAMIFTDEAIFEGTHAALNVFAKQPYVNLLLAEPTARFLELTHDAYARRMGPDLGKIFDATFTDEPSLMSCFLRPMPWRVLAWSQTLPAEFEKRRGRPLLPILPALVAESGTEGETARYDFWKTVGELVSENFFGQIQERCARYGIPSGGHLLIEESLAAHVPFYGDFFQCLRRLDAPSIDCLTSLPEQVPWHIARLARSAADLEGKTLVMCEVSDHSQRYRPAGDTRPKRRVTEAEIRGTLNRLFAGGINVITSYYSFDGLDDDAIRRLNEWTGRCCSILRESRSAARVALLYPAESLWTHSFASRHSAKDSPRAMAIQQRFLGAANALFSSRREFTVIDASTIANATIESGALAHRNMRWQIIILPETDALDARAWRKLVEFAESGGVVVALGSRPKRAFPNDEQILRKAREIFAEEPLKPRSKPNAAGGGGIFLPPGYEDLLAAILDGMTGETVRADGAALRIAHRITPTGDLFLVINDSETPWCGPVHFQATGPAQHLDPGNGQITQVALPVGVRDAGAKVDLAMGAHGASIVQFSGASPGPRPRLEDENLPGIRTSELPPPGRPTPGTGSTVKTVLSGPTNAFWMTTSTLTESNKDSWCFLRFPYSKDIDLSDAFGIAIDCEIPPGQATAASLFAYVHEPGGQNFIAELGRTTAEPGVRTHYLGLSRFRRFDRATGSNSRPDFRRINAISVGWGGYTGEAGEKIEFAVTPPRLARRSLPSPPAPKQKATGAP